MPVELSPDDVRSALARLGEHDLEASRDVEGALEWIAGRQDPETPIRISRYGLQVFLWYQLPRKWLTSPEHKHAVAAGLRRFLELVGEPAAAYARICTSEETTRLLRAWDEKDPAAGELLRNALEASGIEPPDTETLEWGSLMGPEEARLRDAVALKLESAVEEGRLDPEAPGFKRRQAGLISEFLLQSRPELDGRAPLDLITEERLENWAQRGSEERRTIVTAVAPLLRTAVAAEETPAIGDGTLEPLAWLLDAAADGIALTQTGALNRALVRAAAERFPDWWRTDLFGPPHREDDVSALREVHVLARRMRLLRRGGRKLVLTKRAKALRSDPVTLLHACAPHMLAADGFERTAQELAAAVLLSRENVEGDELDAAVHMAIVAEGWNADGEPPETSDVARAAFGLIRLTDALGLVDYDYEYNRDLGSARRELTVTPAGREALRLALRSRALRPAERV